MKDTVWKVYSGFAAPVLVVLLGASQQKRPPKARFAELDVERINIVEKDSKIRMVIAGRELARMFLLVEVQLALDQRDDAVALSPIVGWKDRDPGEHQVASDAATRALVEAWQAR